MACQLNDDGSYIIHKDASNNTANYTLPLDPYESAKINYTFS